METIEHYIENFMLTVIFISTVAGYLHLWVTYGL